MNNVKVNFSIRDLENLSGIKAHTIRIWEKRYNLLEPNRTDTNIRFYSLASLQKLLNITLLYNNGYKISKIASMDPDEIPAAVKDIVAKQSIKNHTLNAFKLAMINFDQNLFLSTYNQLLREKSFREIFFELFIPLLNELGYLWQTNTISPAHEHFISHLVKQKIHVNIEKAQLYPPTNDSRTFVMFLPENEIHEIGLLYLTYELARLGYRAIYLGQSVPMQNLKDIENYYDNLVFITYFTISPALREVPEYLQQFSQEILKGGTGALWVLGKQLESLAPKEIPKGIETFRSLREVISHV
ncbi:MerR family transcriptional regulator [Robertkochia solimangrovi]|uniref:MerR family transcriptional regulator n=1 Tax=Robertkochia solimangrovi TaxID=2213046 RepID=UPI0011808BD3|nr:MerR family transcriptional regulator [Robertkochia solimangrovi]TRZ42769.1 MerR family transcriptional regulator [Robertkochia solimangrovi]